MMEDEIQAVCEDCQLQLENLHKENLISEQALRLLKNPKRIINTNFPVKDDAGNTNIVSGFRIQFNTALGPSKGGVRFHQSVDMEEVTELAFLMTLKTSLFELPYGGAKGGVRINPKKLSDSELERVARGYVRSMRKFMGPSEDIPAPDVNTNAEVMAWMLDEFETLSGAKSPAVFTGKPIVLGGSQGRNTSTSRGGYHVIKEYLKTKNISSPQIAIQGFGNVGSHLAKVLHDDGFKIVAVSDSSAGIYDKNGLDIDELMSFKESGGSFKDRPEDKISESDLLSLPVDLLIPAALGGVITKDNANNIEAKAIIEMANAPITAEADEILQKNGVDVIPDILSNAGGVIVSYFEWAQNLQGMAWQEEKVEEELKVRMERVFGRVAQIAKEKKTSFRKASYTLAIERIEEAERLRGNI